MGGQPRRAPLFRARVFCYIGARTTTREGPMTALPKEKMSVEEFLDWSEAQPKGRFELVHGEIIEMAAERVRHVVVKANIARALRDAVRSEMLGCRVLGDGALVVIDKHSSYEPDAVITCDKNIDLDALVVPNPVVVVEVLSPSTAQNDTTYKLENYLSLPSVAHVLIVDPDEKIVIHHAQTDGPECLTRILRSGDVLHLQPVGTWTTGVEVEVGTFFEDL